MSPMTRVTPSLLGITAASILAFSAPVAAETPVLVKDINPEPSLAFGIWPSALCVVGGQAFFKAVTDGAGTELWKSDGTLQGTGLLNDVLPGGDGSSPEELTYVNGRLFFAAGDYVNGRELWTSDGSAVGTVLLKDIRPGPAGSRVAYLTAVGSTLFFNACADDWSCTLWKSDGTAAGTLAVASRLSIYGPTAVGSTLFMAGVDDSGNGWELWKSDGTAGGTVRVKDIEPGSASSYPRNLTAVGNRLYFTARTAAAGEELWMSDGTAAGTVMVKDIAPGSASSQLRELTGAGGVLFFTYSEAATGLELWKSDGTAAGTAMVRDIRPGAGSSYPRYLTALGGAVLFGATDGSRFELYRSDGTAAGTVALTTTGFYPWDLTAAGSAVFMNGYDLTTGRELWKSDGTAAGTVLVRDIVPGAGSPDLAQLTGGDGVLFFATAEGGKGWQLWRSDGTAAGTIAVTSHASNSSYPAYPAGLGGTVVFTAHDESHGHEVWKTDGTSAGTTLVKDVWPGVVASKPTELTSSGTTVFFTAEAPDVGAELWRSDGTPPGTVLVKDIFPGATSSAPAELTIAGGSLFFAAWESASGIELWKSDGTAGGTVLVKDINPGANGSWPTGLVAAGSTLFFVAWEPTTGEELWRSDGTAAGTVLLKDITPGPDSTWLSDFTAMNGRLFFSACGGSCELWTSDGTAAGTVAISTDGLYPQQLAAAGSTLFMSGWDGYLGRELWKSDGTLAGTVRVKDIRPGPDSSNPVSLMPAGTGVYFRASEPASGEELYWSDGTEAGTNIVRDLMPGPATSSPVLLATDGGRLYFSAWTPGEGRELWRSDGTAAGTALVQDIGAGVAGGVRFAYRASRGLFFSPFEEATGFEPWLLPLCPAITISPASIPTGSVGVPYSQTFTQSGASNPTFGLTGRLPNGLTFNPATATISGTPMQGGSFPITVTVTEPNGCSGSRDYTLTINCMTITVSPTTIPTGTTGAPYSQTFTQTGASNPVFSLVGTLPTGMSFTAATATISGTPTRLGVFPITVRAMQSGTNCVGSRAYTLSIGQAGVVSAIGLGVDAGGNSILEPNETVAMAPAWFNATGAPVTLTGTASGFTGPAGPTYTIADAAAAYGTIANNAAASCGADCYSLVATAASRPLTHWDATVTETPSAGAPKTWTLHVGESFTDVPRTSPFYRFVEAMLHRNVTGGCVSSQYCPASSTTREQMAVFALLAKEGPGYSPPACTTPMFADVPASSPFCRWIEELARRGVVGGCGGGNYCPTSPVLRDQMAVFVLRTLDPALSPPACGTPFFDDVPATSGFCRWVEELARRGVVSGCGTWTYCPSSPVTREQMGVFVSATFGLTVYGP